MTMVHLIRSLLINLNSMIAIEAKYVELCKYTVAYTVLTKKLSSGSCRGGAAQRMYTVNHKKRGTLFLTITTTFLGQFLHFLQQLKHA